MSLPEVIQPGQISFNVLTCSSPSCTAQITEVTVPNPIYYKISLPDKFAGTSILKVIKILFLNLLIFGFCKLQAGLGSHCR